jgi:hypothetical protein
MTGVWSRVVMTIRFWFSWSSLKNFYEHGVPGMEKWTGKRAGERSRERRENRP